MKNSLPLLLISLALNISINTFAQVPCTPVQQTPNLCAAARDHRTTPGTPEKYYLFTFLFKAAGLKQVDGYYTDPNRYEILRAFWKKNYACISCEEEFGAFPEGGLLRQIVMSDFEEAAYWICGTGITSRFKLDLNVKDGTDSLTIIDWIHKERARGTDIPETDHALLNKYEKLFTEHGAMTSEQLKAVNCK